MAVFVQHIRTPADGQIASGMYTSTSCQSVHTLSIVRIQFPLGCANAVPAMYYWADKFDTFELFTLVNVDKEWCQRFYGEV